MAKDRYEVAVWVLWARAVFFFLSWFHHSVLLKGSLICPDGLKIPWHPMGAPFVHLMLLQINTTLSPNHKRLVHLIMVGNILLSILWISYHKSKGDEAQRVIHFYFIFLAAIQVPNFRKYWGDYISWREAYKIATISLLIYQASNYSVLTRCVPLTSRDHQI